VETVRVVGTGEEAAPSPTAIPFTRRAKKVLELSLREALADGVNFIDTEHVLLGLVRDGDGAAMVILRTRGIDAGRIRAEVRRLIGAEGARAVAPSPAAGIRRRERWVHRVERGLASAADGRQTCLNTLGAEGWQLVAILPDGDEIQFVFRRPRAAL
jgi:ATP-dependent Clp protease ATP-binding subunit ClpA